MNEYEVFIEDINSCGGEQYAKKELIEVEAESPEAYVKENSRYPIMDISTNSNGDTVIITGDGKGNFLRYTFSE
jgi:predicted solute-binding protein